MIQPLNDWIVVELHRRTKSKGGLVLPDSAQQNEQSNPIRLRAVAVGPGRLLEGGTRARMSVKPGQWLIALPPAFRVDPDDQTLAMVQEPQVVGIEEPAEVQVPDGLPEELG